jgi:repressor LexA
MEKLTNRQRQILDFLVSMVRDKGRFPSYREIGRKFRLKSPATVSQHLGALARKGYLIREGLRWVVSPEMREDWGMPVVGRVAAGAPITAVEHLEGRLSLERQYPREAHFAVRVRGDSMEEAGIRDGDYVVVREQSTADSGQTVVAYLGEDQDVTVKVFRRKARHFELEPRNARYSNMKIPKGDPWFRIGGRVVGLVRVFRA